ncbi:MAG TPA: DUF748 domain-containing protein, partial [Steroidobacteraceae bacterium]
TPDTGEPHAALSLGKVSPPAADKSATPPAHADDASAAATAGNASAAATAGSASTAASTTTAKANADSNDSASGASSKRKHSKHPGGGTSEKNDSMAIAVDAINIVDGSANYADLWIQPHFAVGIQSLNGSILGLSSNPNSHAKVELKGKVDRYAPVHIWGETNPLAATTYSDIKMNFKGVELTSATPYSGHFAGYKIEKGKLSVDIDYKIENRQLTASHKFVIDQLELGERVESPDAIHLPLKIAVALLKDRNGVIDIDLPVTGSLDDPQFRIGPLIWKAVLNLLTKIATAPFALLGHLFGGGEQMNYIDFHPGSAVLDASEHDKLVALVKALKDKEKLELDVPITYSADVDRPGLAAAHLNQRLLALNEDKSNGHKRGKAAKSNTAAANAGPTADPSTRNASTDTSSASSQGKRAATGSASSQATTTAGPTSGDSPSSTSPSSSTADAPGSTPAAPAKGDSASSALASGTADAPKSALSGLMDAPPPADPALTDPAQRYQLLIALYKADLGKSTPLPEQAQAIENAGKKKDQPPPDYGAANAELEAVLLQKSPVADTELEVLGKHRARAIQDVLLNGTDIDPSRVFVIGSAPKGAPEKDKVRVELALK